jgi:hypothetical protein
LPGNATQSNHFHSQPESESAKKKHCVKLARVMHRIRKWDQQQNWDWKNEHIFRPRSHWLDMPIIFLT